jgi:transposase
MVEGTKGSHHKEGSRKMNDVTMIAAGIDTSKHTLDIAIDGDRQRWQVANQPDGFRELIRLMRRRKVTRIGIEATGGYERDVVSALRKVGFEVVVFQPKQVRAFAEFMLCRAKSDKIDAGLIAACVAHCTKVHEPPDPKLAPLADLLTFIEQIEDDLARNKVRREHARDPDQCRFLIAEVKRLTKLRAKMLAKLTGVVATHDDLARRRELVLSIEGIGERTALAMIIRMPELGRLTREEAASLAGVAPFDNDTGKRKGERHIAGGRHRLRTSVYAAALSAAFFHNPQLKTFYRRLIDAGKPHKSALIACVRKLVIYANTVLARGTPWVKCNAMS